MTDETGGKLTAATVLLELSNPENVSRIADGVARRMAAPSVTIPTAALAELLAAAEECAGVAETGVERKYWATLWGRDDPGYKRDMAPVRRLRAAVARVRGE